MQIRTPFTHHTNSYEEQQKANSSLHFSLRPEIGLPVNGALVVGIKCGFLTGSFAGRSIRSAIFVSDSLKAAIGYAPGHLETLRRLLSGTMAGGDLALLLVALSQPHSGTAAVLVDELHASRL
jgi:hypothetical protein